MNNYKEEKALTLALIVLDLRVPHCRVTLSDPELPNARTEKLLRTSHTTAVTFLIFFS